MGKDPEGTAAGSPVESKESKTEEKPSGQNAPTEQNAPTDKKKQGKSKVEADDSKNTKKNSLDNEPKVDYKAELSKANEQLKKAEDKIVKMKKEKKEEVDDENEGEDMEAIATRAANKAVDKVIVQQREDDIDRIAESMSSSPDEKALILHHYHNSVAKNGFSRQDIGQDMLKAKSIANTPTIIKENSELKEALKSKKSVKNTSLGKNKPKEKQPEPEEKLSKADKKFLKARGKDPKTFKTK